MQRLPILDFVFSATINLAPKVDVGNTPNGRRVSFPITGGDFEGPTIRGKVLPGSEDWALFIPGKGYRVHAEYKLQEDDGTIIHIVNHGNFFKGSMAEPFGFTTPSFEVPFGKHDWLNDGAYIGTLESNTTNENELTAVTIVVYKAV